MALQMLSTEENGQFANNIYANLIEGVDLPMLSDMNTMGTSWIEGLMAETYVFVTPDGQSPFRRSLEIREFCIYGMFCQDMVTFVQANYVPGDAESRLRTVFAASSLMKYIGVTSQDVEREENHRGAYKSMQRLLVENPDLPIDEVDRGDKMYWYLNKISSHYESSIYKVEAKYEPANNFPKILAHGMETATNTMLHLMLREKRRGNPNLTRTFSKNKTVNEESRTFFQQKIDEHGLDTTVQTVCDSVGFSIMVQLIDRIYNNEFSEL